MASPKVVPNKRSQPQDSVNDVQPPMPASDEAEVSTADSAEQIRQAAYYKWEAAGCPCSDGVEFWLQAESEMSDTSQRPAKPR